MEGDRREIGEPRRRNEVRVPISCAESCDSAGGGRPPVQVERTVQDGTAGDGEVRTLPEALAATPQALLLQGMLLAHGGDYGEASRIGMRLLAIDDAAADACHLIALCREGQCDRRRRCTANGAPSRSIHASHWRACTWACSHAGSATMLKCSANSTMPLRCSGERPPFDLRCSVADSGERRC